MKNTGERRVRKPTSVVRRGAGGKGLRKPYLACGLPYFVLFHSDLEELQKVAERVTHWLTQMGLKLSPTKTRTTHTLTPYQGQVGFDFLGFTIQQFPAGKTHTGKGTRGAALGFQTLTI